MIPFDKILLLVLISKSCHGMPQSFEDYLYSDTQDTPSDQGVQPQKFEDDVKDTTVVCISEPLKKAGFFGT